MSCCGHFFLCLIVGDLFINRYVALTMEHILATPRPDLSYKVGPDSKASPFVGMLPAKLREFIVRGAMYKVWRWTPN